MNALAVNPANVKHVFAGTELGGVFRSTDGGATWSHVDQVKMFMINDIKYVSTNPAVIIATGWNDGHIPSNGGIWRSANDGRSWSKTRGTDPTCAPQPSAYRIASATDSRGRRHIYVAEDCGIATSSDFGARWTLLHPAHNPPSTTTVLATPVGGTIQLDTCGGLGYLRSTNGGAQGSWRLLRSGRRRAACPAHGRGLRRPCPGDLRSDRQDRCIMPSLQATQHRPRACSRCIRIDADGHAPMTRRAM